jgi:hypothetical protein
MCVCGGKQLLIIFYTVLDLLFADIRQELLSSISNIPVNITINLLLFGTNELTDEQNTLIFVSTFGLHHDHMAYHTLVTYILPQN